MNETVFESSSSFVNRPEEFGEITGSSAVGGFAASSAVPAGSWPPGIVPEIQSGFNEPIRRSPSIYQCWKQQCRTYYLYFLCNHLDVPESS